MNNEFNYITGHNNLLVSFAGIRQGLGIPSVEFRESIKDMQCDKIFITDPQQAWYQFGVSPSLNNINKTATYLRKIIEQHKYEKVCFIGNSMGRYAAILFGILLNVNSVYAFPPPKKTFIDRWTRLRKKDSRWREPMSKIHTKHVFNFFNSNLNLQNILKKHKESKTKVRIYYAKDHELDATHANYISTDPRVYLTGYTNADHNIVRKLRDNGELKEILLEIFAL